MLKLKYTVLATAMTAALLPLPCLAADDPTLAQIRAELKQLKEGYEARIQALEQRLAETESRAAPTPSSAKAPSNAFNPSLSLILGGSYARLSQDPAMFRLQGFMPGGDEIGPGKRSFNLGESELSLSASVDPHFSGKLTLALSAENQASVEEAFFDAKGLSNGLGLRGGRFLSSIGYLNAHHAHAWDFVDAPLAYQALFGGQFKQDGLQLRWLAPTARFVELGLEAGNGSAFPGNDRHSNGIGATALFAHVGDDIGESASWRAGISYLRTSAAGRRYEEIDHTGTSFTNIFDGKSRIWIADAIYKWAPNGNATHTNFKLQGEYFRRQEKGALTSDIVQAPGTALPYASAASGWYLQGVYQFQPAWRLGWRVDKLYSGTPTIGVEGSALTVNDFQRLAAYNPSRTSFMVDYSPSEFSRLRLQLGRDKSRPEAVDKQIFLQYIMSLGAHGAHAF